MTGQATLRQPCFCQASQAVVTRSTLTCSEARRVIRYEGYRNIRDEKCGGKYHQFTARKPGTKYPVNLKVRATTGKIVVVGRTR